ncbi:hypothetical protein [Bacillus infantis]|uniref:hypothetical protein n=1 Tax=Bacillus infantis TaxID=324767 RepID=UPI00215509B7|nr:hypothetical protein [Bacillus infantis]MCR6609440.1 hypothetical protein [Bacillus infantis]
MNNHMGNTPLEELNFTLERLSEYISGFLGFKYKIVIDDLGKSFNIYGENEKFILPYMENVYDSLFTLIEQHIQDFLEKDDLVNNIHNFTEIASHSIIFSNFYMENNIDRLKLFDFINSLKELSYLTYENDPVNIGIYVCKSDKQLNSLQNCNEFEFINIEPENVKKLMTSEKPLLKLINNSHFNLVVDKEYMVVGVLKKKPDGVILGELQNETQQKVEKILYINSIINEIGLSLKAQLEGDYLEKIANFANDETLYKFLKDETNKEYKTNVNINIHKVLNFILEYLDKIQKNIKKDFNLNTSISNTLFINVRDQEINFWNNEYFPIAYKNGQWKIRSYIHLAHEISACRYLTDDSSIFNSTSIYPDISEVLKKLMIGHHFSKKNKELIKIILNNKINSIKEDAEYIFKLINIIRKMSNDSLGGLFVLITDEEYFTKNTPNILGEKKDVEVYKDFIKNDKTNPHLKDMDADIIRLIASIDGATIFNKDFTINSFSEMIKSQNIDTKFIGNTYGARTLAAINASLFGTSIKVSEDGDITVFRNVIFLNKEQEFDKASMKVLTI